MCCFFQFGHFIKETPFQKIAAHRCLKTEMKYKMTHFRDSKDANWVIGAVLLIAVMVTISVVVDAWAGKTDQFAQVEELTVSGVTFSGGNTITVVVENNGTMPSEIAEVWINSEKQMFTTNSTNGVILPKEHIDISIFHAYSNQTDYFIKMVSERGNTYFFTATTL